MIAPGFSTVTPELGISIDKVITATENDLQSGIPNLNAK